MTRTESCFSCCDCLIACYKIFADQVTATPPYVVQHKIIRSTFVFFSKKGYPLSCTDNLEPMTFAWVKQ